jgi:hypothetical protein
MSPSMIIREPLPSLTEVNLNGLLAEKMKCWLSLALASYSCILSSGWLGKLAAKV